MAASVRASLCLWWNWLDVGNPYRELLVLWRLWATVETGSHRHHGARETSRSSCCDRPSERVSYHIESRTDLLTGTRPPSIVLLPEELVPANHAASGQNVTTSATPRPPDNLAEKGAVTSIQ